MKTIKENIWLWGLICHMKRHGIGHKQILKPSKDTMHKDHETTSIFLRPLKKTHLLTFQREIFVDS
jgi:hypothetical protein